MNIYFMSYILAHLRLVLLLYGRRRCSFDKETPAPTATLIIMSITITWGVMMSWHNRCRRRRWSAGWWGTLWSSPWFVTSTLFRILWCGACSHFIDGGGNERNKCTRSTAEGRLRRRYRWWFSLMAHEFGGRCLLLMYRRKVVDICKWIQI